MSAEGADVPTKCEKVYPRGARAQTILCEFTPGVRLRPAWRGKAGKAQKGPAPTKGSKTISTEKGDERIISPRGLAS